MGSYIDRVMQLLEVPFSHDDTGYFIRSIDGKDYSHKEVMK